jgi:hypothetical protein
MVYVRGKLSILIGCEALFERIGVSFMFSLFCNVLLHGLIVSFEHLGKFCMSHVHGWGIRRKKLEPKSVHKLRESIFLFGTL